MRKKGSRLARFKRAHPNVSPRLVCRCAQEVAWTYDVRWEFSEVKWASRWDVYLYATDEQIHWFSIVNSFMIVLFLTGLLAMIMLRTLRKDLSRYNELETKVGDATTTDGPQRNHASRVSFEGSTLHTHTLVQTRPSWSPSR